MSAWNPESQSKLANEEFRSITPTQAGALVMDEEPFTVENIRPDSLYRGGICGDVLFPKRKERAYGVILAYTEDGSCGYLTPAKFSPVGACIKDPDVRACLLFDLKANRKTRVEHMLEYRIRQIRELLSKKDGLRASLDQVRALVRARRLELYVKRNTEWESMSSYDRDFQQHVWEETRAATGSWDSLSSPSPRDGGRPRVGLMVDGVPFFPSSEMQYHGFFRPEIQDTRTAIKRNFLLWQKKCVDEWMEEFYRVIDRGRMADLLEGRDPDIYRDFDETKPDPQAVSRLRERLRIEVGKLDMIVEGFYRFVEIGLQQTDPKEAEKKIPLLIACDERYREISKIRKTMKEDFLSNEVKRDWETLHKLLCNQALPRREAGNILGAVEDLDRILKLLEVVELGIKEAKQAEGAYAERKAAAEQRIEEIQRQMRDLRSMPEFRRVWEPTRERMEGMIRDGIRPHKNTADRCEAWIRAAEALIAEVEARMEEVRSVPQRDSDRKRGVQIEDQEDRAPSHTKPSVPDVKIPPIVGTPLSQDELAKALGGMFGKYQKSTKKGR